MMSGINGESSLVRYSVSLIAMTFGSVAAAWMNRLTLELTD